LGLEIYKESYTGNIKEITLGKGKNAVTVGGQACYPFYSFEGKMPRKPVIAMEVWDMEPDEWPAAALSHFKDVVSDPAAWAKKCVNEFGYCSVVVSEGVKDAKGNFLSDQGLRDAFGHAQLGGVAPVVANIIKDGLGFKYHWGVADYLQRAARHIASKTDVEQAYAVGKAAVEFAIKGHNAVMPTINRLSSKPYRWKIGMAQLSKVANVEKMMPSNFITKDGFGITERCRTYLVPLIKGEDYPSYRDGLPKYVRLKNIGVKKKLGNFKI